MKRGPGRKTASQVRVEQLRVAGAAIPDLDNRGLCMQLASLLEDFKVYGKLSLGETVRLTLLTQEAINRVDAVVVKTQAAVP